MAGVFRASETARREGLSVAALRARVGVDRHRWGHWTQDESRPREEDIQAILGYFHEVGRRLAALTRADVVAPDAPLRGGEE